MTIRLILFICLLTSCSHYNQKFPKTPIRNKGLSTLSDVNPYLASNKFISELAVKYPILKKFLNERGTPEVIDVKSGFFSPEEVFLYFPDQREHFRLEVTEKGVFEIYGPYRTKGKLIAKLLNLTKDNKSNPKLLIFHANLSNNEKFDGVLVPKNNTLALMTLEEFRSEELKDAELNAKGDLIHKVKSDNENLRIISLWYTYSEANVKRIASINELSKKFKLNRGQKILIPKYILKYGKEIPIQFFN